VLSVETINRWTTLQAQNNFDEAKAQSSLLALPQNLPRIRPANMDQAMSDVFPAISTVKKYHGNGVAVASVSEIIAQAAALLNVGKNLQSHQIDFLACEILANWYWLTIGEVRFVMNSGVTGKYGELYDRLDVSVVCGWFEKYADVRGEVVAQRSRRAHLERIEQSNPNAIEMPDSLKELIQGTANTFLVDGELKKGFSHGEFEPDEPTLRMIEMEWADLPKAGRMPYENYKAMRIAHLKTQMKK